MININYKDPRPIYEQIKDGFIRLITTGVMEDGQKLPSVRELATTLAINPNTIQKAYAQLESEGYTYSVSGKGSFASSGTGVMNKRKEELLSELEKPIRSLKELSCDKKEIIHLVERIFEDSDRRKNT